MTRDGFQNPYNRRHVGFSNAKYQAAVVTSAYRNPPTGPAKVFHDALVRELGSLDKMVMHKINSSGKIICDRNPSNVVHTMYWGSVTCADCLAHKPEDASERTSIKRSHRAEGNNFID